MDLVRYGVFGLRAELAVWLCVPDLGDWAMAAQ